MRVVALLRIEWIKILRRRAFWVALAADVGIVVAAGSGLYAEIIRRGAVIATLAGEWPNILQFSEIASVISAAVVVLLVGTEFSWGTARQSVINGLSRNEYFAAKLLLVPQMGLLFLLATLLAGASVVIIVANPPTIVPWFSRVDLHHVGGTALGILGCGSLAFLIANDDSRARSCDCRFRSLPHGRAHRREHPDATRRPRRRRGAPPPLDRIPGTHATRGVCVGRGRSRLRLHAGEHDDLFEPRMVGRHCRAVYHRLYWGRIPGLSTPRPLTPGSDQTARSRRTRSDATLSRNERTACRNRHRNYVPLFTGKAKTVFRLVWTAPSSEPASAGSRNSTIICAKSPASGRVWTYSATSRAFACFPEVASP